MRYAIIEEDLGFFLGAFQKYGVFAKTDVFGLSKAYSFKTEDEANGFVEEYLGKDRGDWLIVGINTDEKYIDVVHLLKCGYDKYTHQMIDALPMISTLIH
jgi:hypothetical protein